MVNLRYKSISEENLSHLTKIVNKEHKSIINGTAGKEHYKLLSYLSKEMGPSLIVELGTHYGTSSLAFAENKESVILTYDIVDRYKIKKRHQPNNVIRKVKNIFVEKQEAFLLKADLIFMDTYHDGIFEKQVYDFLIENNYNGILLLDDIHWSNEMINFWNKIEVKKHDITDIGHGGGKGPLGEISGTGIVDFSNNLKITV